MLRRMSFLACIVVAGSAVAQATIINNGTGLTDPDFTITFGDAASGQDSVRYTSGTVITTQYSDFGVTFGTAATGGVVCYNPVNVAVGGHSNAFYDGTNIGNWRSGYTTKPMQMTFDDPITGAAFRTSVQPFSDGYSSTGTIPSSTTITAYLDGTQVATLTTHTDRTAVQYLGFTDITFNKIVLSVVCIDSCVYIDDLQVSTIPEPGALVLLVMGLLGLLAYAWRKRR